MTRGSLALRCDGSGRILEVIRDDLDLVLASEAQPLLPVLATPEAGGRCFEMLLALEKERMVFGWLLEMRGAEGPVGLHFAGIKQGSELLLVASRELAEVPELTEELMRLNSEHVNALRHLVKEGAGLPPAASERELDHLTELNNANTSLQRELSRERKVLEATLRRQNELVGMIAHDLRNPLTAAEMQMEFLQSTSAGNPDALALCDDLRNSIRMMVQLADEVLDLASLEAGTLRLESTGCDLVAVVERAVLLARPVAQVSQVELALTLEDGRFEVQGDEAKLRRVLDNLISNALKHSPAGGCIEIALTQQGAEACISIVDEGPGVPADERERIFEAFERGRSEDRETGAGLGLVIARRIAEGHGGRLVLVASDGPGARFELWLPLGRPAAASGSPGDS